MSKETEHGRLIAAAANTILAPLGCKQIGRSRVWIADQRFWVIVIEFQPSGFSKGSYLNVGVSWLWNAKDHWSFDHGGRVEAFTQFQDAQQFAVSAEGLATRAGEEIRALRKKFASLSDIAREIAPDTNAHAWPVYHAAVVSGLVGDIATARRLFKRLNDEPVTFEWQKQLKADSASLAQSLTNVALFREKVLAVIHRARVLHRLTPDPTCLDGA